MKSKLNWLEIALLAAPFGVLAIYWNDLPTRVPMHWNLRGEIDGWGRKMPEIFFLPVVSLALNALLRFLYWLDPKLRRTVGQQGRMPAILPVIRIALAAFFDAIFFVQIAVSLGQQIPSAQVIAGCVLVLFVILGNYLGNVRPNYFVGIRTPWTLENPETWRATHRLGGRIMFFGGLILLIAQFFLPESLFAPLFVVSILALVAWAFVYSWHHSRTHVPPL